MKSKLDVVMGLYHAIFQDLMAFHPSITQELSRDISRLRKASLSSGLPLFTITLPMHSKYLERSLELGHLDSKRPPLLGAKSKSDPLPDYLYGLWSMIFEADGTLKTNADVAAISSIRQVSLAVKKLRIDCEERYTNAVISTFREIERSLPASWEDTWDVDHPKWRRRPGHPIWGTMDETRDPELLLDSPPMLPNNQFFDWPGFGNFVARALAPFGELDVYGIRPKHGPGAVSDRSDHTKYDQRYWTRRLEDVFPYDYFAAPNSRYAQCHIIREFPSQLIAVPKTQSGPRLIAAEPTSHQWIQGGLQRWLEDKIGDTILKHCITFRSQDRSRFLAQEASRTREKATIDLRSASDRLTTRLVEYIFQSNRSLLDALHACRTRVVSMDRSGKDLILLRKFSTQGSACTFPVQTIVFSLIAIWAIALTRKSSSWTDLISYSHQVQVFGDDIILPSDSYGVMVQLLAELQLEVNESKSFVHGYFRESCGMDSYKGVDVTPAYFRQFYGSAPTSLASVIECSNNFHMKGFWHTAAYIQKTVPNEESSKILIRGTGVGSFGLVSFCGTSLDHLRGRYNKHLHRNEVKILDIQVSVKRSRGLGFGDLSQFFQEFSRSEDRLSLEEYTDMTEAYRLLQSSRYTAGQVAALRCRKTARWVSTYEVE